MATPNRLLLELEDFVRVVQTTGETIQGRYDGKDYEFPDAQTEVNAGGMGYRDVHRDVAQHIFGFGLKEISDDAAVFDKLPCLMRLGWISGDSKTVKDALTKLRLHVQFLEIPPFPVSKLEFKRTDDTESQARVPSPSMGQEGGPTASPVAGTALEDPFKQPKKAGK